ncbi:MAG: helicase-related protein, partial [Nitrososphaeria archaeon]
PYILNSDSFDPKKTPDEIFQRIMIHHAGIKDREKIEKEFVDGKLGALISTSTLELGVDYPNVTFIGIVGVPFILESIPQRIGRAGRNPEKTLYTTLSIIVLRNTPMELYYLYNPEDLIEGFRNKDIPIAWKNTAVKRYQVFSLLLDEMARKGKSTYILGSDGRLSDLKAFIDEASKMSTEAKALLDNLNARIKKEEDVNAYLLLEELMEEFDKLPIRIEEWKRLSEYNLKTGEIINVIEAIARRAWKFGERIGDGEMVGLARELFKLLRKVYT